jgi:hypothetical protein
LFCQKSTGWQEFFFIQRRNSNGQFILKHESSLSVQMNSLGIL